MDRKIELDNIPEESFQDMLTSVNTEILNVAKRSQNKINKLLSRFNIKCELTLNYSIIDSSDTPSDSSLKRRGRKKKGS